MKRSSCWRLGQRGGSHALETDHGRVETKITLESDQIISAVDCRGCDRLREIGYRGTDSPDRQINRRNENRRRGWRWRRSGCGRWRWSWGGHW